MDEDIISLLDATSGVPAAESLNMSRMNNSCKGEFLPDKWKILNSKEAYASLFFSVLKI